MQSKYYNPYLYICTLVVFLIVISCIPHIQGIYYSCFHSHHRKNKKKSSALFLKEKTTTTTTTRSAIIMAASSTSKSLLSNNDDENNNNDNNMITILGFGSLLSEKSSRTTFPSLQNFRLGRVHNYRRVFRHPASIFFQRGIANLQTKEISSLCAEPCNNDDDDDDDDDTTTTKSSNGFICSIFEVPNDNMMLSDGVPSQEFLEREEEFNIIQVPYIDLSTTKTSSSNNSKEQEDSNNDGEETTMKMGILCTSSSDEEYLKRWGKERFHEYYGKYGINTIWGWKPDSGLRPCPVYLRHCYLAAKGMGEVCFNSFLDETFLIDRKTTIREYIANHPEILETSPPPELVGRYSG